jgi:ring-1,2-phenylacetyl-CoA epoxidase subunit PaaC
MQLTLSSFHEYLLSLADDELVLGHRDSEWCGHAPILEEDIAFANIALDEIGHANLWYSLLSEIEDQDPLTYPDQLVYFREPRDFRNIQMVELPNSNWAFSLLRQYIFDEAEIVRLKALVQSQHAAIAGGAGKILNEELYHHRHTSAWVRRLSLGTDESQRRMQNALDEVWPYTGEIFSQIDGEEKLIISGIVPDSGDLHHGWLEKVVSFLQECSLSIPGAPPQPLHRQEHTPHLTVMLKDLQSVARSETEAKW